MQWEKFKKKETGPHKLTKAHCERRMDTCIALISKQQRKSFLWKIVTGDEKCISSGQFQAKKSNG